MYQLTPKFILIIKKARLTFKWLTKMIIDDGITSQEKDLLTKILYNQEVILAQNFKKIGMLRKR